MKNRNTVVFMACFLFAYSSARSEDLHSSQVSSVANPVRKIILKPVSTKSFTLPNGSQVDLSDLTGSLMTSVVSNSNLSPVDPAMAGYCDSHLELRSNLAAFEIDLTDYGVSFGYTENHIDESFPFINVNSNAKVGRMRMDFGLWQCNSGHCTALVESTSEQNMIGLDSFFKIDFSHVTAGGDLISIPAVNAAIRTIMREGIQRLVSSPRMAEIPWHARIIDTDPSSGTVLFDAGMASNIQPFQDFEIYAIDADSEECNVYRSLAYVHTTQVNTLSSTAFVDLLFDRKVKTGDLVMIRIDR